ncbi:uncharacterized protein FOMMEDRAFT_132048 [Fomitiporia mediterranea MF3/22]|uniref:uncharacterized protein n=1 Tax=Fomitiporia mediterranea (strain MF3/22) TaxID=694068 RepID=UPI00044087DD|nr:uncharacterized protein FOMMEDRAFT_132048 [Fomitiporia mediterranea MF3/22]EJD05552.1 hypothetical protein FOMMEDRAFT_132048 [Fomitiporia mediterranea MF3/22]
MVAQTRTGSNNTPARLKFSDKLVGKGFTTDVLQKKLKKLHTELADLDQESVDTNSLRSVSKELISTSILLHKDKGVKAYAACCLADILRLFAPDAPYTGSELRDIFQFFFRQLSIGLKGSTEPYYNEYFHLLESLSTVKSVVLVCDLPQAEELMAQIFRDFFGLVRQELAKNIEMCMSDILIALIDECQALPSEVLESIMAQFMDKNARMDQPAYRLAVEVCNATSDKLHRNVSHYFADFIHSHAGDEEYDEISRCHELIKRLNAACPALLHNVVPQLEEEMRAEQVQIRILATQVLGEMFADKADGDLEKKYPSTWSSWLMRRGDKSPQVRLAFVEGCKGLLLHHRVELREAVEEALNMKLLDPDEKVRAAACKLYSQLDYETALHYVSEKQLRAVGDRVVDKKQNVRQEAMEAIARLFNIAYPEIESNDAAAVNQFSWIPQRIFSAMNAAAEIKQVVLQVIADYILPLPNKNDDEVAWTERLLTVMRYLDERAIAALVKIANLQQHPIFELYLQSCIENNGGIIDENEEAVKKRLAGTVRIVSGQFADAQKAADDLQTFARMNETRLYKLLKTCMDPQSDLKGLVKAFNDFIRRVEQSTMSILPTMRSFVLQSSLWIVNQSSVPTLVKKLGKGDSHGKGKGTTSSRVTANNARTLLTTISKFRPVVYRALVSELGKAIADDKNQTLVEVCLQALAAVSRYDPDITPNDRRTIDRLVGYVRGPSPKLAKFAARVLAFSRNKDELCSEIVKFIATSLPEAESETLVAHLAVLVEMVRSAPDAFEQRSDVIIEFLLKEVLMKSSNAASMDVDDDADEWIDDDNLHPLGKAKVLALKVCRHRCLVHSATENALDVATPVLKMLVTLLENSGSLSEQVRDEPTVKSRLRLQAARSLLALATVNKFSDTMTPNFASIALTIQDPCFNVRFFFLRKLAVHISSNKLPSRFNVILFLTVHDPEKDIRDTAEGIVRNMLRKAPSGVRLSNWEMIFIRLLHVIAHHPDFGSEESQVFETAKYIQEYLSLVATSDNVSLLYNLAQKCKTVRDFESQVFSDVCYFDICS